MKYAYSVIVEADRIGHSSPSRLGHECRRRKSNLLYRSSTAADESYAISAMTVAATVLQV